MGLATLDPPYRIGSSSHVDPNDHVLDYVNAYLHKLLTAKDAETLEKHCAACKICQVALGEAQSAARGPADALRGRGPRVARPRCGVEDRPLPAAPADAGPRRPGGGRRVLSPFAGLHVYYLALSPSPCDLRVLGQSELVAQSGASLRVLLVNHDSGKPMEGVPGRYRSGRSQGRPHDSPGQLHDRPVGQRQTAVPVARLAGRGIRAARVGAPRTQP